MSRVGLTLEPVAPPLAAAAERQLAFAVHSTLAPTWFERYEDRKLEGW